jgi:hypothetical protein
LSVEYGVYIPLFAVLFCLDNRYRYIHPIIGHKDSNRSGEEYDDSSNLIASSTTVAFVSNSSFIE